MNTSDNAIPTVTYDLFQQLVDNSPHGILVTDEKGAITLWNPALAAITGIPEYDALGQPVWAAYQRVAVERDRTAEGQTSVRALFEGLLAEGEHALINKKGERVIQHESGELRVMQYTLYVLKHGESNHVASIIRDVTQEHQTLNQLRRLTQAVEQSPVSVVITDPDGVIEYANPRIAELTGYPLDELVGKKPSFFKSGLTPDEVYKDLWTTISTGKVWVGEIQNRKANGDLFWEKISISPIFDERGKIHSYVAVKEDISAQKAAELAAQQAHQELTHMHTELRSSNLILEQTVNERTAELQRLNDRMAIILNNVSDAIILLNADDLIENANQSFHQMFGYERDETFRYPFHIIAEPTDTRHITDVISTARTNGSNQRAQFVAKRKDGRKFDAEIAVAYVKENGGHLVCSVRDITHMKEVERAKDAFLSMVSHELKNPISAISLSAENLNHYYDRLSDERRMEKLVQIREQAGVLTELVTSILDTARFEARKGRETFEEVDVCQIMRQVVNELKPQAEINNQHLDYVCEDDMVMLSAVSMDISRVWRNLISNALKYCSDGATVRARLYPPAVGQQAPERCKCAIPSEIFSSGNYVIGMVEDDGPGISEADQEQLFTRFFRGWAGATDIPGTGLGLSLVKEIIMSYGGDITVSSQLNHGTIFCFWFPLSEKQAASVR